jgi:NAD(P)-dependent dehydrogenase (short-subunit alcohol dehydrogenase family)
MDGGWSAMNAYCLSKKLVIMFTNGLYYLDLTNRMEDGTTLITIHPGVVNTKLLKTGWGAVGIATSQSHDTYRFAIESQFENPKERPYYYIATGRNDVRTRICHGELMPHLVDKEKCVKLTNYLMKMVKIALM